MRRMFLALSLAYDKIPAEFCHFSSLKCLFSLGNPGLHVVAWTMILVVLLLPFNKQLVNDD